LAYREIRRAGGSDQQAHEAAIEAVQYKRARDTGAVSILQHPT
jgi:hypothetical protein